jgi:hypothetical protein
LQESEDTEQETESSDVGGSVDNFAVRAPKRPKTKNGFVIDDEDEVSSVGSSFSLSRIGIIEVNCELRFPSLSILSDPWNEVVRLTFIF